MAEHTESTPSAATAFTFQLQSINRVTNSSWYPIRQGDPLSDSLYDAQHPLHGTQTLVPNSELITFFLNQTYVLS